MVFVALGSNVGDRESHLASARRALAALPRTRLAAVTPSEETAPVGPPQGAFLNQMALLETDLEPHALLDELQRIERDGGRVRDVRWGPRTIDLDIVRFGDREIDDARLTVPHPELPRRDFWRRELALLGELS